MIKYIERIDQNILEVGKLPPDLLENLLAKIPTDDPSVVLGPKIGEDAAVVSLGDKLLVAKSDPITFATANAGWYAVQINANDIACAGGVPKWFLATLLLPETIEPPECEALFSEIIDSCAQLNVSLIGGHSEITLGIDRPIILGTMLGEVQADNLTYTGKAQEGDSIVLTKGISIEGTSILAREKSQALLNAGVSQDTIDRGCQYLNTPGISVVPDAQIALHSVRVHAMHDPTEGGLFTGLKEIAKASGLGLAVEEGSIAVLPETEQICIALGLNPFGLLASGALLITLPSEDVPTLLNEFDKHRILAWEIGQMIAPEEGLVLFGRAGEEALPEFERDELASYLAITNKDRSNPEF